MISINVDQLLTISAGNALALRGAYVTLCHWLPDLEANPPSSGFYVFYFISFIYLFYSRRRTANRRPSSANALCGSLCLQQVSLSWT